MSKNEIKARIEEVEEILFNINMIDHWTREDSERYSKYIDEKFRLIKELEKIN